MGLDAVELIMAVEEKFGINISDEEAQEMRTVGQMYQYVVSKVAIADRSSCATQKAFHLLRRTARKLFDVPGNQFRPETKLKTIVPRRSRRENWQKFQAAIGATKWPKLSVSWPGTLAILVLAVGVPGFVLVYGATPLGWNSVLAGALAVAFMALTIRTGKFVVRPFETEFRGGLSTVRELTYVVLAQNPELFGSERSALTADEIWSLLASIIKEQTGVAEFTKDSRFVEDLSI